MGEIVGRGKTGPASTLVPVRRATSALHCPLGLPNMLEMEYFDRSRRSTTLWVGREEQQTGRAGHWNGG